MKIELKKLSINLRMSEETTCFVADLYIDGLKAGTAENTGKGGMTSIKAYKPGEYELTQKAEAYLESFIDDLVYAEDLKKQRDAINKRIQKDCIKSICWGSDPLNGWRMMKYTHPLSEMLKSTQGIEVIKRGIEAARKDMKPGEKILNTNLPSELL